MLRGSCRSPMGLLLLLVWLVCRVSLCHGYIIKEDETFIQNPYYSSQEDVEDLFARLEKTFPENAKVETIGRSLEGRNLIVLKIGKNTRHRNLLTPLVKYIANMHGDETIGRQMLIYLAQYLLYNYETNLDVANLVNTTDIYLMPTMNPDGFARSKEGYCESLPNYIGRTNAAGVDLNRDFPDRLENQQSMQIRSQSRQPETAALVEWIVSKPFVLSANFHGGAIVASYPYDNSIAHHECCEESLTPDDRVFKVMAHTYADSHPIMRKGKNCNDTFADGITNGAHWYELNGGMQDFNYAFTNCFELTIELSCCKYPPASTLPIEWQRNKRSLMNLLKLAHIGIKGLVKDASGYPINDATIVVSGLEDKPIRTTQRGEYWRLLTPGLYNVQAVAFGYQPSVPQQVHVTNENSEAIRLDFVLKPIESNYDGPFRKIERATVDALDANSDGFLTPTRFEHHNYTAMEKYLHAITKSYPTITRLYSIGQSVQKRNLWVMEIFAQPGEHVPGVPEFKYVANMHGNEVVGKEMLLLLTKYICERYMVDDRITRLVNNTRMHFLYSMNPDGYEIATEGDKTSAVGRANANHLDLNRNFPDQYGTDEHNAVTQPEVEAVMNWTLSLPFVLSANLHGGSLVANYPYDDNENDFKNPISRLRLSTVSGRKVNPTEDNELFKHLALVYSMAHPTMHLGDPCPLFKNEIFPQGITNGAKWYSVTGGMQDWNYVRAGVLEVTIEMGCDKFPMAAELPKYWREHRESLLLFIEQIHYGVHGFVRSSIGSAIAGAMVSLDKAHHVTYSAKHGDYWKLALPGRHALTVVADGFAPQRVEVEIPDDKNRSIRIDVTLMRDDPQHWSSANDFRIIDNVHKTHYHNNNEIRNMLATFETRNGQIATFGYAESEFGMYYNSMKLTSDIGEPEENKYKILILSSFFDGVTPLGREIVINLIRHVIEGYRLREPSILRLLQRSVLYLMPTAEKFQPIYRKFSENNSVCDPHIGNDLAERILSPESEKLRDLFLQFLDTEKFDLMLTFTTGNSDTSYPKSAEIYQKIAHQIDLTEFTRQPLKCATTTTRSQQHDATERLTNLLYKVYKVPMFSLGLSCCRMPMEPDIASVWRKNLDKLKNFLHLIDTGINGEVQDEHEQPLRNAFIRIIGYDTIYNVSRNVANFQAILPAGNYGLEIAAPNYESQIQQITVVAEQITNVGIVKLNPVTYISGHSEIIAQEPMGTTRTLTLSGFVLDLSNHPIVHAKVSLVPPSRHNNKQSHLQNFTDNLGAFSLNGIPSGNITLLVEASHYHQTMHSMYLKANGGSPQSVIVHLKFDEHVLGMPRIIFIIFASILIIGGCVCCALFVQFILKRQHRLDRRYYNFSLLPQKSKALFEDDDLGEDDETELFRAPIQKGMTIKPYYDENFEEILPSDSDGALSDDSREEIIMRKVRQ